MNIGEKMRELLRTLHEEGVGGVDFPDASLDGEQTEDYGLIRDLFPNDFGTSYFDYDACREDFVALVRGHFASDPTVKVEIDGFNYVEAIRR